MTQRPVLVLATNNAHKEDEWKSMLHGIPFEIKSLIAYPKVIPAEENGDTFLANAILKARAVAEQTGEYSLADDSGLAVDALNGRPGIYSSRYAPSDPERIVRILTELKDIPEPQRTARFVCAVAIVSPQGQLWTTEGVSEGVIIHQPRGTQGFGYDPIFLYPDAGKTFAEMNQDEKNKYSHRGFAAIKTVELLSSIYSYP